MDYQTSQYCLQIRLVLLRWDLGRLKQTNKYGSCAKYQHINLKGKEKRFT